MIYPKAASSGEISKYKKKYKKYLKKQEKKA